MISTDTEMRKQIARIGKLMFDRRLTDSAGGNISVRAGEQVFATPRYSGSKNQWELSPEQILQVDPDNLTPEQVERISREIQVHFGIYAELPLANAVIHAHPRYVMPFVTLGKSIPPVWEDTQKFGVIELVPERPAHSPELAASVVEALRPKAEMLKKNAIAVLMPKHGIVVVGRDLDDAYDALERINGNAECILLCKLLQDD